MASPLVEEFDKLRMVEGPTEDDPVEISFSRGNETDQVPIAVPVDPPAKQDEARTESSRTDKQRREQQSNRIKQLLQTHILMTGAQSAKQHLHHFRNVVLGPERLIKLVAQGYTPRQIGTLIGSREQLAEAFRSIEGEVADTALGVLVLRIGPHLESISTSAALEEAGSNRLESILASSQSDFSSIQWGQFPEIDYGPLYRYIEDEMQNGNLVSDPAWHETYKSKSRKKVVDWRVLMDESIASLTKAHDDATYGLDWCIANYRDQHAFTLLNAALVINLVKAYYQASSVRLPAGPVRDNRETMLWYKSDEVRRLGYRLRGTVAFILKRVATYLAQAGVLDVAETFFQAAFDAGSNAPDLLPFRAAALLRQNKPREVQKICTIALKQLDVIAANKSRRSSQFTVRYSCQTTRPLLAELTESEKIRMEQLDRQGHLSYRTNTPIVPFSVFDGLQRWTLCMRAIAYDRVLEALGGINGEGPIEASYASQVASTDAEEMQKLRRHILLYSCSDRHAALLGLPSHDLLLPQPVD